MAGAEQLAGNLHRETPTKRRPEEIENHSGYESVFPHGTVEVLNLNVDGTVEVLVDNGRLKQERGQVEQSSPGHQEPLVMNQAGKQGGQVEQSSPGNQEPLVMNQAGKQRGRVEQSSLGNQEPLVMNQAGKQSPSPTCLDPSISQWPGLFLFDVNFTQLSPIMTKKSWGYSKRLKKLFVDMNSFVLTEFRVGSELPEGMYIRVLPIYAVSSHVRSPVIRCPNHASLSDPTNQNFPFPQHLIRIHDENAIYDKDVDSERLSVVFPIAMGKRKGTDKCFRMLKFMCLGSDVGGINRKPVKVIFTLEAGPGVVVGRKVVDVRICFCPQRDMQQEEERQKEQEKQKEQERQKEQARSVTRRLAENVSTTHIIMEPLPKKKKMKKGEEIIMVPVAVEDFQKINEMAEAIMIQRQPEKAEKIREMRRQRLTGHNQELIHSLEERV